MAIIDMSSVIDDFDVHKKPLLFGGAAMEYDGLRSAGKDLDFIVTQEDFTRFTARYPARVTGENICLGPLECWRIVRRCTYEQWEEGALEASCYRVLTPGETAPLESAGGGTREKPT